MDREAWQAVFGVAESQMQLSDFLKLNLSTFLTGNLNGSGPSTEVGTGGPEVPTSVPWMGSWALQGSGEAQGLVGPQLSLTLALETTCCSLVHR